MTEAQRQALAESEERFREWMAARLADPAIDWAEHPKLCGDSLSPDMQVMLGKHVFSYMRANDAAGKRLTDDQCYQCALWDFGVVCPHPVHKREFLRQEAFKCHSCGCLMLPRETRT